MSKIVLVTGTSSGIGKATALHLAQVTGNGLRKVPHSRCETPGIEA